MLRQGGRRASGFLSANPVLVAAVAIGLGARLGFWLFTDRVWEDALITVMHARNAVAGIGLTPSPGEGHVQGFTSALSVLIPWAGEALHPGAGILALRIASLLAFVAAAWCANQICRDLGVSAWGRAFPLFFLALEENQIFYGMAGMETQVAVAILLASVLTVLRGHVKRGGVLLGFCLLARPDFIIWVVPAVAGLIIHRRAAASQAIVLGAAVVAPWLVFTTLYYGSPLPHTIGAKAAIYVAPPALTLADAGALIRWAGGGMAGNLATIWHYFTPFLANSAAVAAPVPYALLALIGTVVIGLVLFGMVATRRVRTWWPVLFFLVAFVVYRGFFLPSGYYDWYLVPFTAVCAVLAGKGIDQLRLARPRLPQVVAPLLCILIAVPLPFTFVLDSRVQHQVEERVRVPLAEYLGKVAKPDDGVVTESSGYVGYYSRTLLWDFPGLTSSVTARLLAGLPPNVRTNYPPILGVLIERLQPKWAVLRGLEIDSIRRTHPEALRPYAFIREYRVTVPIEVAGLRWTNVDEDFWILERS